MKIRYNENKEIVEAVKQGLKEKGGYCPCRREKQRTTSVCARSLENKLPTLTLRAIVTVCYTIKKNKVKNMSIINLTKDSYHNEVMETEKVVVIDFWATWCGPCKMMAPVVEEVAKDYPDVKVCKVNVDEEPELSNAFKIVSIPTIVVIKNGEIIDSVVGYRPKEDIEKIIKLVK